MKVSLKRVDPTFRPVDIVIHVDSFTDREDLLSICNEIVEECESEASSDLATSIEEQLSKEGV